MLAGRRLPLLLASTALFATWFGSETVLGASSEFVEHGLIGVVEDPFGAALCLLLVGLLVARPLYRLQILTFCDYYRDRFGTRTEFLSSLCMVPSYFGWIAAQLVAIGIIFRVVAGVPTVWGIVVGTVVVVAYTYVGGLWAVSITDFLQTVVILAGLIWLAVDLTEAAGGLQTVLNRPSPGFFRFWPEVSLSSISHYVAAWITIGLGSIPQQDVFQRVMAAKSERVAVRASYIAAGMYVSVGMIPLLIGLCALQLYPAVGTVADAQLTLPTVVMQHAGTGLQILFFGALLSAIMSTTSGAVLAPAHHPGRKPDSSALARPERPSLVANYARLGSVGGSSVGADGDLADQHLRLGGPVVVAEFGVVVRAPDGRFVLEAGYRTGSLGGHRAGHDGVADSGIFGE